MIKLSTFRNYKRLCESSSIDRIETTRECFSSDFSIDSFRSLFDNGNHGRRDKESCVISPTKNGSFIIWYYDLYEKKKIEIFPSYIKKITYK